MKELLYNKNYYIRGSRNSFINLVTGLFTWINLNTFKNNFKKNNLILEVGCGDGKISKWLSLSSLKIDAIDISKDAIGIAKKQTNLVNYTYGDIFSLKRKEYYYDAVYSLHVMEHIENIEDNLKEIYRIIKRNGKFVIRIPNRDSIEARLAGKNWFHWDEPYHKHHWSVDEFKNILLNIGFNKIMINYNLLEFKQVLLYSCINRMGIKTKSTKTRLLLLPLQTIFVPISVVLGCFFKNSGTVELVAFKTECKRISRG